MTVGRLGVDGFVIAISSSLLVAGCGGGNRSARKPREISSTPLANTTTTSARVETTKNGAVITILTKQLCEVVHETPFTSGGWIRRKDRKPCNDQPLAGAAMLFRVGDKLELALGNTDSKGRVTIRWSSLRPKLGNQTARFGKVVVARTSREVATLGIASQRQSAGETAWRRAAQKDTAAAWAAYRRDHPRTKSTQAKRKQLNALIRQSDNAIKANDSKTAALVAMWKSEFAGHGSAERYRTRLLAVRSNADRPRLTKKVNAAIGLATKLAPGYALALLDAGSAATRAARKHNASYATKLVNRIKAAIRTAIRRAAVRGRALRRRRKINEAYSVLYQASILEPNNRRVKRELGKVAPRVRAAVRWATIEFSRRGGKVYPSVKTELLINRRARAKRMKLLLTCTFRRTGEEITKNFTAKRGVQKLAWQPAPAGYDTLPADCALTIELHSRRGTSKLASLCWRSSKMTGNNMTHGECK